MSSTGQVGHDEGTGGEHALLARNLAYEAEPTTVTLGRVSAGWASNAPSSSIRAHPQAAQELLPGTRIGQYELIRELGRGGMGTVYLARDTRLGRRVAIKLLRSSQAALTARFIREARATARCSHENIVIIYEVGEYGGNPFMVLEYLQGTSLSKQLQDGRKLPPGRAVELMVPVVRALERAHEHNIVHRDLKPDNIYVTDTGLVKVLDFGIAKLLHDQPDAAMASLAPVIAAELHHQRLGERLDEASDKMPGEAIAHELTQGGMLLGTLPYMSPEQWGADTVDHRSDLWAVGILLFTMVAGRHPLAPHRGRELVITSKLDVPMPGVRTACPDIPDELAGIIDRCLVKPKEQRMGSARELLAALEPLLPGRYGRTLRSEQNPYAGLGSFQEADADRFFGRSREIAAATARLRERPVLGVVGPSGVGKSSFVRAGVVPALKRSGEPWATLVIRPGRQPMAALAHLLAPMVSAAAFPITSDLAEHQAVLSRLHVEPGYLGTVLRNRARRSGQSILLFVDQFEELYTLVADAHERKAFTRCLASVADDAVTPLRVVISIRSDFLDRVPEDEHFMAELMPGLFFLTPPGREGLRDAITQPAEMAGYGFEQPAMIEHMLDHLEHTPGALPLLQFAATKLWDLRDSGRRLLTEQGYGSIGGIAGALASHADAVLAELPAQTQALARALLLRLVTPERTRAIVSLAELCELSPDPGGRQDHDPDSWSEVQRLVEHLVHARLLVIQTGDGAAGASVEIIHESLIHCWPLLGRWLDENQDDAAFLEQLRSAARQWQAKGRPGGLLWRGEAMEEARRWHRRYRGELPELQRAYLAAVFALAARAARRQRVVIASIIGFLCLLVAAATVALLVIREAKNAANQRAEQVRAQLETIRAEERARREAEKQALAAQDEVAQANIQLDRTNEQLERKNTALVQALDAARQAMDRARLARQQAQVNEAAALQAEAEARWANQELQVLLERERERVKRLEAQGGTTIIEDVDLEE